jgi:putative oxidoreductase
MRPTVVAILWHHPAVRTSRFDPIVIVRVAVAILLGIHGFTRALGGGVVPFGAYLAETGFPLATALAAAITGFEMVGSILLALGRYVRFVTPGFMIILLSGIALVHGREGWFVVGGGRNGVEYSVLLIACLAALTVHDWRSRALTPTTP